MPEGRRGTGRPGASRAPGLVGALLALALQAALRFTAGTPLAPEELAQRLFQWVPMGLFELIVDRLGGAAKWVTFAAMVVLYLAAGALAAPLVRRGGRGVAGLWAVLFAAAQAGFLVGQAPRGGLAALGAYFLSTGAYVWLARRGAGGRRPPDRSSNQASYRVSRVATRGGLARPDPARRRLLAVAGVMAVGAVAGWLPRAPRLLIHAAGQAGAAGRAGGGAALTARLDGLRGVPPWVTPNRDFYRVSKNLFDPRLSARSWRLKVDGLVEHPFELSLADLAGLGDPVAQFTTLSCISNPVGGDLIGNARWRGVPLRLLLQRARLLPGVVDLRLEAADGYTDSIPLEKALHPATLLAWEMNGEPLPPEHGFPARLVVPGIYGMKNVKWLTRIEAVREDYKGYWEVRGWSDTAVTRTLSRIDVPKHRAQVGPGPVYVAGIAFAGDRGISRVEVSFDAGATWQEAELEPAPTPMTWVRWLVAWHPPGPGRYTLVVRAYDGRGERQEERPSGPLPAGATGLHRIEVEVATTA